jgi:hypothetical protein
MDSPAFDALAITDIVDVLKNRGHVPTRLQEVAEVYGHSFRSAEYNYILAVNL